MASNEKAQPRDQLRDLLAVARILGAAGMRGTVLSRPHLRQASGRGPSSLFASPHVRMTIRLRPSDVLTFGAKLEV